MKKFVTIFALFFSMQVNASIINLTNTTIGDNLLVTLSVDNTANNISEVHFNLDYDFTQLTFIDFEFSTGAIVDDFISDAFDIVGSVFVDVYWSDLNFLPALAPAGVFELGTASFKITDVNSFGNDALSLAPGTLAADVDGTPVEYSEVPAPSALALLAFGMLVLMRTRKTHCSLPK